MAEVKKSATSCHDNSADLPETILCGKKLGKYKPVKYEEDEQCQKK